MKPGGAVVVFARAPELGAVKTRLAREVGDARALELYLWLGARVVRALADAPDRAYTLSIAYTPERGGGAVREWLPGADEYLPQSGADLGARMASAIAEQFERGHERVVVVGTDCAAVDAARADEAMVALGRVPCVLGPADDGGYYLVGAARPLPIFAEVAWSTDTVLTQTRALLRDAGLAYEELATERDVDVAADLVAIAALPGAPSWAAQAAESTQRKAGR